jgi:hypothetical protein
MRDGVEALPVVRLGGDGGELRGGRDGASAAAPEEVLSEVPPRGAGVGVPAGGGRAKEGGAVRAIAMVCVHCGSRIEARHAGGAGPWLTLYEAGTTTRHACARRPGQRSHRPVPETVSPAERAAAVTLEAATALGGAVSRLAGVVDQLAETTDRRLERTSQDRSAPRSTPPQPASAQPSDSRGALAL